MNKSQKPLRGAPLLRVIAEAALDKKADDVAVLNLSRESGIADWFIICQGDNPQHNRAIADNIETELEKLGMSPWHIEGSSSGSSSGATSGDGRWIVMDFSDVIVHVMTPQVREYYDLEGLWEQIDMKDIENRPHE
jgi:ribosome-associated protein